MTIAHFQQIASENLSSGIILFDHNLIALWCNPAALKLSGLKEERLWHLSELEKLLTNPSDNHQTLDLNACLNSLKKNDTVNKSAILTAPGKQERLVFLSACQINIPSEKKTYLLLNITDISQEVSCRSYPAQKSLQINSPLARIVGRDPQIINIHRMIELAADSMANILIHGESGTGKELIAEAIHLLSDRKDQNIVKVNCSALSESLLESELFGHIKGSFTNAMKDKKGKFEEAHKGTIFLDEIGEISHSIQVKLLRVIQEKTIERVGDNKPIKVDMRIIAATNKDLRQLVAEGKFREDLFYRLNVFPIKTLPLREHKNDIPLLCDHFINKYNQQTGKHISGLSQDAWRILLDYCWPGNVRELENAIEHAFVLCQDDLIDVFDLPQEVRLVTLREGLCKGLEQAGTNAYSFKPAGLNYPNQYPSETEKLKQLLERHNGNRTQAANELGISRVALWKKLKKHGIS